jgi:hypothetical protein
MIVDAHVFYWTGNGMQINSPIIHATGYVEIGEVERMLEDAYRLGYEARERESK